ncbi:methyl-accepting chemotaxis protein [Methylopila sp. M107]|uniref:methyl-accepting chemotaxis protein n=1 Tax=Methylopila sp. M107 TaxID=1101190 RepID=UPI00036913A8|nr:methyl-accepting chemotaxis protein [Methylopila sp. M107]
MSFGFGRAKAAVSNATPSQSGADDREAIDQSALVAALTAMRRGQDTAGWPSGDVGVALQAFAAELARRSRQELKCLVGFASQAASTGAAIGWVTHDVRQVADGAGTIAGAVEELAGSISELSAMSNDGSSDAIAVSRETTGCLGEMRQAANSMETIRERVGAITVRIDVLENAVRQIAEMADAIEAISSQTNLLALNATIEAARAGEAGRGFAVVANEVKSLSGQTAKATEQIRARIATLMEETDAIKRATAESADAVATGDQRIRATGERVETVGVQVSGISSRMQSLSEVLGQQRAATNEISESVSRIASLASKTRGEIGDALDAMVAAERSAMSAVDAAANRGLSEYEFLRLSADAASERRRLGAMLVGASPPERAAAFGERLDTLPADRRPAPLMRARDTARAEADKMIAAVKSQDWAAASSSFERAEAALAEVVRLAESEER